MAKKGPIGVFDSGYGGLTILRELKHVLPQFDYIYLGDNARAPYGNRSFESVYEYTWECVQRLFEMDCRLVLLACNTASAKALRTIQQKNLTQMDPLLRVLGVIRPTAEIVATYTQNQHVGILGTSGTVSSESYPMELKHYAPDAIVTQQACPMWVPMIENNEFRNEGAAYFIQKYLDELFIKDPQIDTLVLGCTHYPLLEDQIRKYIPDSVEILSQGNIVAASLQDYLRRHPEMEQQCTRGGSIQFYTTDDITNFDTHAAIFFGTDVKSKHINPHK